MQTLKDLTSSLHDSASLQRLRDNLNELPKRWLARVEQPEDYLLGSVRGECNYHFKFRLEGGGYFQTGVLVASAEASPGGLPVPLKCRWKRKIGDLPVEIPGVTSNMYQISADDVGTDISVEAQPADVDDGHHGTVIGEIGPFELDPATRRSLDNALGLGGSRFAAMQSKLPGEAPGGARQDLAIQVSSEGVRVTSVGAGYQGRDSREVYAEYSSEYPKVIIHPLDTTKFRLVMSEVKTFHLMALTRTARDLIALTIRCFHAKKYMSTSSLLQTLLPVQAPATAGAVIPITDARLDACIVLETLAKVSGVMTGQEPKAVQQLVSDLKMMAAYDAAADWGEAKAMDGAYAAMSWDDAAVKAALPEYLKSSGEERAKVDYAFGALILRPPQTSDVRQAAMQTWIKARLFTYNKVLPFDFSPPAA
ncbi:AIR9 [Symbiodinium microadriaticum]|nr:AIR9 [Symbiodinium microadriaticum]CAE7938920.1 AIR9 [Symbiodinium sp. KB8]